MDQRLEATHRWYEIGIVRKSSRRRTVHAVRRMPHGAYGRQKLEVTPRALQIAYSQRSTPTQAVPDAISFQRLERPAPSR